MGKTRTVEIDEKNKIVIDSFKTERGNYLNVRKFYLDKEGEFKPGKQGFSLHEDHVEELLKKMSFAHKKIEDEAEELDTSSRKSKKSSNDSKSKNKKS